MKKNIFCFAITVLLFVNAIKAQDNWNNQNPATNLTPQFGHSMSYIGDDKVVVFTSGTAETWIYDLSDNTWTNKNPTNSPSGRFYSAIDYAGGGKVVLYGGTQDIWDPMNQPKNDTWVYDLSDNTWTLKNPTSNPGIRFWHSMASVGGDQLLLFGGQGSPNDTWVYDLSDNTWTTKNPGTSPPGGYGVRLSSIGSDKVLLFASQTWVYDLSDNTWTQKITATSPQDRTITGMAQIGSDQVLLFGGLSQDPEYPNPYFDDTWVFDLSDNTWELKSPAAHPGERGSHTMASIGSNKVLLSGGLFSEHDTWLYTATAPACSMEVSAGNDENLYFGYAADQCAAKTVTITDGTSPFSFSWTLDRALLPGESITGNTTASVTVCLLDTAELCVTVTDGAGCQATDCATIFAEDVRCSSGNSSNQKVKVCHNGNTICVESAAVNAHIGHGDYIGNCTGNVNAQSEFSIEENSKKGFTIYPNPGNGNFIISIDHSMNADKGTIRVLNMSGQLVKRLNVQQQHRISLIIKDPGVYIVQLVNGKETISKKLIVY